MNGALRVAGLAVHLGGHEVLRDIALTLPAGRWTAIVGPNGAGKTTLVKALAQLIPHQGVVHLYGRDIRSWSHRERARTVAWLGQNEMGTDDLRAHDVVMLGRLPHQAWLASPSVMDRTAVESAMRQTQSWNWRGRSLGSLSGGERQRVMLARALAVQAPLLIMDEPLANLDPPHQSDWLHVVRRHVRSGGTAISVLHELTMALHADDMVVMSAGCVIHQGGCADSDTHRCLERVFDQRITVHSLANQWVALPHHLQSDTDSIT